MASKLSIPDVIDRFVAYCQLPGNAVGGILHLYIDDEMDMDDASIGALAVPAYQRHDLEAAALVEILTQLSKTQRKKLAQKIQDRIYPRSAYL